MSGTYRSRISRRKNPATVLIAVAAVLMMVSSAFVFANDSSTAEDTPPEIVYDSVTSLSVDVVYHSYYGSAPTVWT